MSVIKSQRGGSRTDTMVKLVLIFFISLLSFSVGTYVGKQVSDNDHRRAQIEGDYDGVASHGGDTHDSQAAAAKQEEEKLSDDEIASLTEEFVTKEKEAAQMAAPEVEREIASQPEETSGYKKYNADTATNKKDEPAPAAAPMPPANRATASQPAEAPAKAAERVAGGQAPAADMPKPRAPDAVLPSVAATAVGKYTVQVASYPDEAGAKTHAADLKGKGWNAFYVPAEIQGKTWYRVSVGLFTSAKSAAEFRKEFQKESKVASAIVQKIIK